MNGVRGVYFILKLGLALLILAILSCSGGDGTDGTGEKPKVQGTAATGKPLAMSEIDIKSTNGLRKSGQTSSDGKFSFTLDNMSGPYLIRVRLANQRYLYSVATKPGTVNVHPLTDLIIRNWFKVQGRDVELEFDNDAELLDPPSEIEINAIKQSLAAILAELFNAFGLNDSFDLINSAFNANGQDFDRLLDFIKVQIHDGKVRIRITDPETSIEAELADDLDIDTDLTKNDDIAPQAKPGARILGFGASDTEIIVVWTPFTDNIAVTGYDVYRDGVKVATTPFPVFWDKGLNSGQAYCYSVQAFDAAKNPSTTLETATPCPMTQVDSVAPSAPTNLTTSLIQLPLQDQYALQLDWTLVANEDVIAYEIYRSVNDGAYSQTPYTTVIEPPFSDVGLAPATKYCYKLKSVDATFLRSVESAPVCDTTPADSSTITPLVDPIAQYTSSSDVVVTGVAEPYSVVHISGGAAEVSGNASDSGAFSVVVTLTANSVNNLSVFAIDPSNNQSAMTTVDKNGAELKIAQDTIAPSVVSVEPANNMQNVSPGQLIRITFNENLRPATVTSNNVRVLQTSSAIAGSISVAGNIVTFTPSSNLVGGQTYTVQVSAGTIQDLTGNTLTAAFSSQFTVSLQNSAPTAVIAPIQPSSVSVGATISLNGSGSSDPDLGDTLRYAWSFASKPANSTASIASPTSPTTSFDVDVDGIYQVQLIVTDSHDLPSAPALASVSAGNLPNNAPTAVIAAINASIPLNTNVGLDGTGSNDPDAGDSIFAYLWTVTKPGGSLVQLTPSNTSATPSFTADLKGDYSVELVVTDTNNANSTPATASFNVPNSIPTAVITSSPANPYVSQTVTFDGSGSSDPDVNDTLSYTWTLVSKPAGSSADISGTSGSSVTLVGDIAGDYQVSLVVTDSDNADSQPTLLTLYINPLPCNTLVSGTLTVAGELDHLTINGNTGDVMLLTLVETGGGLATSPAVPQWTLTAPSQAAVGGAHNANSETAGTLQESGDYLLEIRASDLQTTGNYNVNFACVKPIAAGTPTLGTGLTTGSIDLAGESDVYTFNGTVGDLVNFTLVQTAGFTGTAVNLELYSPSGNLLNPTRGNNANSEFRFTLSETGAYAVRINAYNYVATGNYSIGMQKLLPVGTINMAPGDLITGNISAAAEQQIYYLAGNSGDLINFTLAQTAGFTGTAVNLELFSPSGNLLNPTAGNNANSEFRFTLSETGIYAIRIKAYNNLATGTYKIGYEKLLPVTLPNGTISPGDLVTASINEAAQQDLYTFTGNVGDLINFTLVQTAGFTGTAVNMEVFDPSGNLINPTRGNNANSEFRFTLSSAGTYIVRINAYNYIATGTYKIGFERLLPVALPDGNITPGAVITGTIVDAAQQDLYTFDGSVGDVMNFTLVQTAGFTGTAVNMEVFDPSGNLLNPTRGNNANSEFSFTLQVAGSYTIRVNAYNYLATGTYKISLEKLLPITLPNATIAPGDLVTASITEAAQQDLYTFVGSVGDLVNFTLVQTAGFTGTAVNMEVFDPSGNLLNPTRGNNANSEFRFTLQSAGSYAIRVNAYNYIATGTYKIGFERLLPVALPDGVLTPGSLTTATIIDAAEQDIYTFDGAVGDIVNFTLVQTSGFTGTAVNLELFDPSGNLLNPTRGNNANSEFRFTLQAAGTFVVRINAYNYLATGTYKIGFEKLFPVAATVTTLVPGSVTTASIIDAGQQDIYTFSGNLGDVINLAIVQTTGFSGTAVNYELFDPSGNLLNPNLGNNANSERRFVLPSNGNYVVRVSAYNHLATGDYKLGYEKFFPAAAANGDLTGGGTIAGSILEAAQEDFYTFTTTGVASVTVSLTQTSGFTGTAANFVVLASDNSVLGNFNASATPHIITIPADGVYVIRVISANLLATGAYNLTLTP